MLPNEKMDELRAALRAGMADLAERLLGPPNQNSRNKREWRWGGSDGMSVYVSGPKAGAWRDFRGDAKGDPLRLITHTLHCDFIGAVKYGCQFAGIPFDGEGRQEDPAAKAVREAEYERRRAASAAEQAMSDAKRIATARRLWDASTPLAGTVAERYLTETRAIPLPAGGCPYAVRFHPGSRALILAGTDDDGSVRFVQRVFVTADGRKIDKAAAETRDLPGNAKRTDGVMLGAFVRLPGLVEGPRMMAEGPETGLSIWAATGRETWMSIGSITRHSPPIGARSVICRDDDKAQSPADKALSRVLDTWRKAGSDIAVATPWPVRRGDSSDFNDTIREAGAAAVHARIEAALAPPAKPVQRVPVAEARLRLAIAIDEFVTVAEAHGAALAREERKATAELTAKADFPLEVITARQARAAQRAAFAALRQAAKLPKAERATAVQAATEAAADARRKADAAAAQAEPFKREKQKIQQAIRTDAKAQAKSAVGSPPVHAVRVDVGGGKSAAARRAIAGMLRRMRESGDKRTIAFAVPTHALGTEQAALFEAEPDALAAGLKAAIWRGREALDPTNPGKTMCQDLEAIADAREAIIDPQTSVCRKVGPDGVKECFFFNSCSYQAQRAAKADLWFAAHELLFLAKPAAFGDLAAVIVDESAWQDGLIGANGNHVKLSLDTLDQYDEVPGEALVSDRLRSLRQPLHDALSPLPVGPVPRSAILRSGIDAGAAAEAHKIEWMRKVNAEIYPDMNPRERKEAVKAAAINRTVQRLGMVWRAVEALARDDGPEASGWIALDLAEKEEGTVRVIHLKGCKSIPSGWEAPTLLIDATLQLDLVRPFWPRVELKADIQIAAPHQHVIQVGNQTYSKRRLANPRNLRDVHAIISREARALAPGRVLAVIQKDFEEQLPELGPLPANLELAHHNAVAGRDEWGPGADREGVVALIVVGRTAPSPVAVERQAEALTGQAIASLPAWYDRADSARELADGTMRAISADRHPNPVAEAIRWQISEGEIIQIIGRPRGVNRTEANPVAVLVMTDAPLQLPVASVIGSSDLDPSPGDLMMAAEGVALESPTDAATAYPSLWSTPNAAKLAFLSGSAERSGTKSGSMGDSLISIYLSEKDTLIAKMSHSSEVRYQRAGPKLAPSTAWYDPATVPDIAGWLTERLGALAWCGEPPAAARKMNAIEAMVSRGVVLSNPAHAFAFYDGILFRTLDGTRKAIQRAQSEISLSNMARVPVVVSYQVGGAGQKETTAFTTQERLATLRADLEAKIGVLVMFKVTTGGTAPTEPEGYGQPLDVTAMFPPMVSQPFVAGLWSIRTTRSPVPIRVMDQPAAPFPKMDCSPISWVRFRDRVLSGFVTLTARDAWAPSLCPDAV